ncbi:MAG: hypothetical protein KDH09_15035, partial [Chrysiogenetes bacterium]|nr:hypothetical protein [Chrysiogenetes bacterium]
LNEEQFLFDASALYYRYDMKGVYEVRPSWFREWAPWYPRIGVKPARAFSIFHWLSRRCDPLVVPLHPHYTGAAQENLDALGALMDWLGENGARFVGAEAHARAHISG